MSQPQKITDYSEFLPSKERRTPLPITNLPVNAISEESDPTLEIRTLIEQLQQSAREARMLQRSAEQDRDAMAMEVAQAQHHIEKLQENERELRSHFVEVTAIIRERDAAIAESERRGHSLADATKKCETAGRERTEAQRLREDAIRQRDEATRKLESLTRSSEENTRLVSEVQKQILTIRQARDSAQGKILELSNKLGAAEDQVANIEYERDTIQKAQKQAAHEASDFRRQLDLVTTDRDATAKQNEQLTQELDQQRKKYLDLVEQKSAAIAADGEHLAALAEARAQVASLGQERDAARLRLQEQTRELEELRAQFQVFRDEESQKSSAALSEAHDKFAALETQAREARQEAESLRERLATFTEQLSSVQKQADDVTAQKHAAHEELEKIVQERDGALDALNAAQKQIDHLFRDREQISQLAAENAQQLETQIGALRSQVSTFQISIDEAWMQKRELAELNKRFEKQRLESIDLATQVQAAQREIRELSANLAEARLQVKFASAATRATKDGKTKSDFANLIPEPEEVTAPGSFDPMAVEPVVEAPEPIIPDVPPVNLEEPLTEKAAKSALAAMRQCFQAYTKTPHDVSLLNELHCHVHSLSDRARVSGLIALHRLSDVFSALTRELYEIPEQINPSTLRTVQQTIDFMAALMKERSLAQVPDPAKAVIYAVDDDLGNCESIALAMEESMMRTSYAQEPLVALSELAGSHFDLIFLDVNLPGMDGFELCKQIRAMPMHATTPIVFLTGLATVENRVQSSMCGGNDFVAKPFNLNELSIKALTLILKAQLGME